MSNSILGELLTPVHIFNVVHELFKLVDFTLAEIAGFDLILVARFGSDVVDEL